MIRLLQQFAPWWQSRRSVVYRAFSCATIPALLPLLWPPARQLEYEYALLTAWCLAFLPPLVGWLLTRLQRDQQSDRQSDQQSDQQSELNDLWHLQTPWRDVLLWPIFAMIPGVVLWMMGQCPCGVQGLQFWMWILAAPAAWIGLAGLMMTRRLRSRRWMPLAIGMVAVVWTAAILWFFPQKRVINPILGFLHGPIYDRWIPVDAGVILARLSHGLCAIGVAAWCTGRRSGVPKSTRLCFVLGGTAWLLSWGWDTAGFGSWFLSRTLSSNIQQEWVEVSYERRSAKDESMAQDLARDAGFHVDEIARILGVKLSQKIKIYAYRDGDQKKLLFGGGDTDVTDVWSPSVHVELRPSPHPTLRHELVHAVASFVSWHGIGFHPNMVITEGLAMALAPTADALSFDQITAELLKSGRVGDVASLFSPLTFWQASGVRSYMVAGSLLRWIHEQFGSDALRQIYQGESFERATGSSLSSALARWRQKVLEQSSDTHAVIVERLSRDPGVLGDRCPHASEDLIRPRSEGLLSRLRQPPGWDPDQFNDWRLRLDPADREAQLAKLKARVRDLMISSRLDPGEVFVWRETIARSFVWPPKVAEDLEAALLLADFEAVNHLANDRRKALDDLAQIFKEKNPGSDFRRSWEARVQVENSFDGPERDAWRSYLAEWTGLPPSHAPEPWIASYLRARRVLYPTRQQVDEWLNQRHEHGMTLRNAPGIDREWLRMAAIQLLRFDQFTQAAELFEQLASRSTGESKLLAQEHLRRARYFAF